VKSPIVRELRAVPRYSVSLPVCVTWRDPVAQHPLLNALTRDISTRGMFIIADANPAEGELLEFEIDMALDEETPLVVVQGAGRVVRTERPSRQSAGFAVHNLWFRLREPAQGQAMPLDFQALANPAVQPPLSVGQAVHRRGLAIVPRQVKQVKTDSNPDSDQGESK
jgi:hypothetical protein